MIMKKNNKCMCVHLFTTTPLNHIPRGLKFYPSQYMLGWVKHTKILFKYIKYLVSPSFWYSNYNSSIIIIIQNAKFLSSFLKVKKGGNHAKKMYAHINWKINEKAIMILNEKWNNFQVLTHINTMTIATMIHNM